MLLMVELVDEQAQAAVFFAWLALKSFQLEGLSTLWLIP